MSVSGVERCLYRLKRHTGGPAVWGDDPSLTGADGSSLTDAERRAITEVDIESLWAIGVHPLLLLQFARSCGIPALEYYERIRGTGVEHRIKS